jgi:hypothetical protein
MIELLSEADSILEKKELSVDDYKRFKEIGRKITDPELIFYYGNLEEAFYQRLKEIIEKEGNDNFLEEEDK